MDSSVWPRLNFTTKCVNGIAAAIPGDKAHTFRCKNVSLAILAVRRLLLTSTQIDLYDFINHATLGSPHADYLGRTGSSAWGWTDPESSREFVGM